MAAASIDFIDTFYHSIGDLHSVRKSLNKEYSAGLIEILKQTAQKISNHTGTFLHEQLHDTEPDEDILKKMISASPSSLSYTDEDGEIPIHSACYNIDSIPYVSLLAKEGVKYKVGGEDGRGGLLVDNVNGDNSLHLLGIECHDDYPDREQYDEACVNLMEKLEAANFLTKNDIMAHNLLYYTCCSQGCKQRFDFLCNWCPEGMKDYPYGDLPIIHAIIGDESIECFAMFLKAATKHHSIDAALLFQTDNDGITACQRAFTKFGIDSVMQVIGDCIPFDNPQLPILHHVAKHAPQLMNDFSVKYLFAAYLRDANGRNLEQTLLSNRKTTFKNNSLFFIRTLTDDQVREIDPVTDLYPFMVAASGDTSDLSAVYVLLRRNPSLVRGGNPEGDGGTNNSNRRRRRSTRRRIGTKRSKQK